MALHMAPDRQQGTLPWLPRGHAHLAMLGSNKLLVQAAEEAKSAADLLQKAEAALEEVAKAEAAAAGTGQHPC